LDSKSQQPDLVLDVEDLVVVTVKADGDLRVLAASVLGDDRAAARERGKWASGKTSWRLDF
jgi:hypothetical protein